MRAWCAGGARIAKRSTLDHGTYAGSDDIAEATGILIEKRAKMHTPPVEACLGTLKSPRSSPNPSPCEIKPVQDELCGLLAAP
jgi:hypothetical protein